jgi:hypothetical protein
MNRIWKWGLGAVLVLALAGAAGRLVMAQSEEGTPGPDGLRENFVARLAEKLGIGQDELESAVQETQLELLDEAVAAGRIDEERAGRIRERIESGEGFAFGFGGGHHGPGHGHHVLEETAEFLGIERSDVLAGIEDGQTLGEIAAANGSSAEALVDHLVGELTTRVNEKVAEGDISQERADEILSTATERITNLVNREPGEFRRFREGPPGDMPEDETPAEGNSLIF